LPPYGWVEFDPTPPDPSWANTGLSGTISRLIEALDLLWFENVVNYDIWKQIRLIDNLRSRGARIQAQASEFLATGLSRYRTSADELGRYNLLDSPALISTLVAIFSAALLYLVIHRKRLDAILLQSLRRSLHKSNRRVVISSFYSEALALLSAHGFSRVPAQTFLEFAQSLENHPAKAPFEALTRIYNGIRFGPPMESEDLTDAADLLKSLRKRLG